MLVAVSICSLLGLMRSAWASSSEMYDQAPPFFVETGSPTPRLLVRAVQSMRLNQSPATGCDGGYGGKGELEKALLLCA
jgi:hypothetical protein